MYRKNGVGQAIENRTDEMDADYVDAVDAVPDSQLGGMGETIGMEEPTSWENRATLVAVRYFKSLLLSSVLILKWYL